jgi:hypothetical protein
VRDVRRVEREERRGGVRGVVRGDDSEQPVAEEQLLERA